MSRDPSGSIWPVVHVVDDDAGVRKGLCRLLEAAGYTARPHASAGDFLLEAPFEAPACVLLDVRMPGPSGLELQEALVGRGEDLPIVFLSGHGDIPMAVRALKLGAVDFLTKPVKREKLLAAVAAALAHGAERRQEREELRTLRERYETLTPREREVLALVVSGRLNKQIAGEIGAAERTVKAHRANAMEKLGADSLADLVRIASRLGVPKPPRKKRPDRGVERVGRTRRLRARNGSRRSRLRKAARGAPSDLALRVQVRVPADLDEPGAVEALVGRGLEGGVREDAAEVDVEAARGVDEGDAERDEAVADLARRAVALRAPEVVAGTGQAAVEIARRERVAGEEAPSEPPVLAEWRDPLRAEVGRHEGRVARVVEHAARAGVGAAEQREVDSVVGELEVLEERAEAERPAGVGVGCGELAQRAEGEPLVRHRAARVVEAGAFGQVERGRVEEGRAQDLVARVARDREAVDETDQVETPARREAAARAGGGEEAAERVRPRLRVGSADHEARLPATLLERLDRPGEREPARVLRRFRDVLREEVDVLVRRVGEGGVEGSDGCEAEERDEEARSARGWHRLEVARRP